MKKEFLDYLKNSAEAEQLNILSHKIGLFGKIFSSQEKRDEHVKESTISLGKIMMINDVMAEYIKIHKEQ